MSPCSASQGAVVNSLVGIEQFRYDGAGGKGKSRKMNLPFHLYRFRDTLDRSTPSGATINYTEEIFKNHELFFSSPDGFNDPFDCGFCIPLYGDYAERVIAAQAFDSARRERPGWSIEKADEEAQKAASKIMKNHRHEASRQLERSLSRDSNDKAGILCLTEGCTDILLWSHYADRHKGVCLEFRTDVKDSIFARAHPVKYSGQYPRLNLQDLVENKAYRDAAEWMLTKSSVWSYEQEWRILDFEKGPGAKKFDPACLSAVILGCRIPDKERKRVFGWIKNHPTPVKVLQAKKSYPNFRLDIEEVPLSIA
jgi:hypothetical protein